MVKRRQINIEISKLRLPQKIDTTRQQFRRFVDRWEKSSSRHLSRTTDRDLEDLRDLILAEYGQKWFEHRGFVVSDAVHPQHSPDVRHIVLRILKMKRHNQLIETKKSGASAGPNTARKPKASHQGWPRQLSIDSTSIGEGSDIPFEADPDKDGSWKPSDSEEEGSSFTTPSRGTRVQAMETNQEFAHLPDENSTATVVALDIPTSDHGRGRSRMASIEAMSLVDDRSESRVDLRHVEAPYSGETHASPRLQSSNKIASVRRSFSTAAMSEDFHTAGPSHTLNNSFVPTSKPTKAAVSIDSADDDLPSILEILASPKTTHGKVTLKIPSLQNQKGQDGTSFGKDSSANVAATDLKRSPSQPLQAVAETDLNLDSVKAHGLPSKSNIQSSGSHTINNEGKADTNDVVMSDAPQQRATDVANNSEDQMKEAIKKAVFQLGHTETIKEIIFEPAKNSMFIAGRHLYPTQNERFRSATCSRVQKARAVIEVDKHISKSISFFLHYWIFTYAWDGYDRTEHEVVVTLASTAIDAIVQADKQTFAPWRKTSYPMSCDQPAATHDTIGVENNVIPPQLDNNSGTGDSNIAEPNLEASAAKSPYDANLKNLEDDTDFMFDWSHKLSKQRRQAEPTERKELSRCEKILREFQEIMAMFGDTRRSSS